LYFLNVIIHVVPLYVQGPPIINNVSDAITVKEGDKAYLTCSASNDVDSPYPLNFAWHNDRGIQLKSDGATDISVLLIDPVNIFNAGVYTCQAYNHPESIAEQQINLNVKCMHTCNNCNTDMRVCLICIFNVQYA